jgi:hypothetical protein
MIYKDKYLQSSTSEVASSRETSPSIISTQTTVPAGL